MIYLISDLHGDENFKGFNEYLEKATKDDLLIILGDVGLNFDNSEKTKKFTKYFLSANKRVAILDGNHDNFEYLNSFPIEKWKGGVVSRLTENVLHLKRGNIYEIQGKSFFVFGGCKSSSKWKEAGLWHDGEEPSKEELTLAYENLKKANYKVDYVLTHKYEQTPPRGTVSLDLQKLTSFIEENVKYKRWYAGHWHKNQILDEKHLFVYDELIKIDE